MVCNVQNAAAERDAELFMLRLALEARDRRMASTTTSWM
jgi:hypothetical protein